MKDRPEIVVLAAGENNFDVTVRDAGGATQHTVTATPYTIERLAPGHREEAVIEAAFRFLLDREPKEAILRRFGLDVISVYFPDFEAKLPRYLRGT